MSYYVTIFWRATCHVGPVSSFDIDIEMAQPLNIKVSTIFSKATYDAEVAARTLQGSEIAQSIQSESTLQ
jgi:hypothetical protein